MKKLISAMVSLAVLTMVSVNVFASTNVGDSRNVQITTSVAPTYTVTIPANTNLVYNATTTSFGSVILSAANLVPGGSVSVSVSKGDLVNTLSSSYKIPYAIKNLQGNDVSSINLVNVNDKADLNIDITSGDWSAAKAGNYSATVTFNISLTSFS